MEKNTVQARALVDKRNIAFLHWVIESYDGIAIMSTLDSSKGLIEFHVSPDYTKMFIELINSLDIKVELLEGSEKF